MKTIQMKTFETEIETPLRPSQTGQRTKGNAAAGVRSCWHLPKPKWGVQQASGHIWLPGIPFPFLLKMESFFLVDGSIPWSSRKPRPGQSHTPPLWPLSFEQTEAWKNYVVYIRICSYISSNVRVLLKYFYKFLNTSSFKRCRLMCLSWVWAGLSDSLLTKKTLRKRGVCVITSMCLDHKQHVVPLSQLGLLSGMPAAMLWEHSSSPEERSMWWEIKAPCQQLVWNEDLQPTAMGVAILEANAPVAVEPSDVQKPTSSYNFMRPWARTT